MARESRGKAPKTRPYNVWEKRKKKGFEGESRPSTYIRNAKTERALLELCGIFTWEQFVAVCEEQARKRGY